MTKLVMMNVKELISKLQKYNGDCEVVIAVYQERKEINDPNYDFFPDKVQEITEGGIKFIRISAFNDLEGN